MTSEPAVTFTSMCGITFDVADRFYTIKMIDRFYTIKMIDRFYTIKMIDQLYAQKMEQYRKNMKDACMADWSLMLSPPPRDNLADFRDSILWNVEKMLRFTPDRWLLRPVVGVMLALAGVFFGTVLQPISTRRKIEIELSANRKVWLDGITVLEQQWSTQIMGLIKNRTVVIADMNQQPTDVVDTSLKDELFALDRMYQALNSENKKLQIQGKSVQEYLAENNL